MHASGGIPGKVRELRSHQMRCRLVMRHRNPTPNAGSIPLPPELTLWMPCLVVAADKGSDMRVVHKLGLLLVAILGIYIHACTCVYMYICIYRYITV